MDFPTMPPDVAHSHDPRHHRAAWIVATILAVIFIPSGLSKLFGAEMVRETFQQWGYETWFLYTIGILEVTAGILVLVPRLATYAAGAIGVEMLGALVTALVHAQGLLAFVPILLGALALYTMWARIPDAAGTEVLRQPTRT